MSGCGSSEKLQVDVLVVGAGPAGSSAASVLARAGVEVMLVDKACFPRDKCCGDGLTTGALRRLDTLGLDLGEVSSFTPVEDIAIRSPIGRVAHLPLARPGACGAGVARRRDLDTALVALARASGATVLEGQGLAALDVDESTSGPACTATLDNGAQIRSRYVVAADGAWSKVRTHLAREPEIARHRQRVLDRGWHAWRVYARDVGAAAAARMWVWFDAALLPGYVWSFPLSGNVANIGICLRRGAGANGSALAAAWRDALAAPFLLSLLGTSAELEAPAKSWPIPTGIDDTAITARGGHVLYVGDAACAADPLTGEGIAQALETGMGCAEAIVALGAVSPVRAGAHYCELVRFSLALEHRMSRVLSRVISSPLGARGTVLSAGWNNWTRRNAGRWLFEAVPRTLPLSPSMWRGALAEAIFGIEEQ